MEVRANLYTSRPTQLAQNQWILAPMCLAYPKKKTNKIIPTHCVVSILVSKFKVGKQVAS